MDNNEIVKTENNEVAIPQETSMPQVQQFKSMWNDKELLAQAFNCATYLSKSALVPETYQGKPENALIAVDLANRSGMSPLTVMQNLYVVKGKPAWSGQFAIALVNASRRFARPLKPISVKRSLMYREIVMVLLSLSFSGLIRPIYAVLIIKSIPCTEWA